MPKQRRQHSAGFKFKVALEAAKGLKTINQLASEQEVHPNLVSQWKRQLMDEGVGIFKKTADSRESHWEKIETELYEQIGRLKMELE